MTFNLGEELKKQNIGLLCEWGKMQRFSVLLLIQCIGLIHLAAIVVLNASLVRELNHNLAKVAAK